MIGWATLLIAIAAGVLEVVTLATLWDWFAVPAGLFRMSWTFAFVLILLFRMLTFRSTAPDKRTPEQLLSAAVSKAFTVASTLGIGWMLLAWGSR